jgi:hypothetical protein
MEQHMAAGMTTHDVVIALTREHARLMRAVDALGEDDLPDARVTLSHLDLLCARLTYALDPRHVVPSRGGIGPRSFDQVRAEFDRDVRSLIAQVRQRSDAVMNATDALPQTGTAPLWELIGGDTFLHEWPAHAAQMEQVIRRRGAAPRQP